MVPAMIAVSTMPPLALFSPLARSCPAPAAGNFTRHSATASRAVTDLAGNSPLAVRPLASRWQSMRPGFGVIHTGLGVVALLMLMETCRDREWQWGLSVRGVDNRNKK